jgi:DNA-directed RNA polymerase subunit RPC12/RpoP
MCYKCGECSREHQDTLDDKIDIILDSFKE